MSIDFDSAALQTQQEEEEEYDQEDYAREQELHKLLTDLPDDMLEDSRDCSSPELDYSTCSPQGEHGRPGPQHAWNGQPEWSNQARCPPGEEHLEDENVPPDHPGYTLNNLRMQPHSHVNHLQGKIGHLPQAWEACPGQDYQFASGDYTYTSAVTVESSGTNNFTEEGYEQETYMHTDVHQGTEYQDQPAYGDHANGRNNLQNFDSERIESKAADCYKASYHPQQPMSQPQMFNTKPSYPNGHFDQLQREFLDSSPGTADAQELAQLNILKQAQSRQIEDLEQKLEDSRRKMRYLEHQFAIVKDEKDGLAISLTQSSHLIEEEKERASQLQGKVRSLEQQVQGFAEREQENIKKQRVAEATVDSMQQQMTELCRSDTLTRAREQHDRDVAAMREQHEARVLALQEKLDSQTHSLEQQLQTAQRQQEQVRQLEKQREEEQVKRAAVINALTQRLEESQQQCAKLLQTGCVQDLSQMQIKLQQALSSRNISENMNKALQEELNELKEQITLYESAVKLGAISVDSNPDWENQLSESYIDLGISKEHWKNARNHSVPVLSESSLPMEDLVKELKSELQRCLAHLKIKRQKISQLQEERQTSCNQREQLQRQLGGAEKSTKDSMTRERGLEKLFEPSNVVPHKEFARLEEERQHLQKRVETLEAQNAELKQSEEKVKAANSELCTKMREMIQELDQEKQEAAERNERTQQQYRDDVVERIRAELTQEHASQVEQLTAQHQQQIQELESRLADLSQEVLAVKECYISVCKEKDKLEENLQSRIDEERRLKEKELKKREEESEAALERLKADLASQHKEAVALLKSQWTKEKDSEVQLQVTKQLASAKQSWQQGQKELENTWARRLEQAVEESRRTRDADTQERSFQTDCLETGGPFLSSEQLEERLHAQRVALQRDADSRVARAVEEALRQKVEEMQQKHVQDVAFQVEGAVSRARARWVQELSSLPEYEAALHTERNRWEEMQQQQLQEQVSSAITAAEHKWQEAISEKHEELENYIKKKRELEDLVLSLNTQLERRNQEQTELLKAELSAARAMWCKDKEDEISRLTAQLQREQQDLHEKHQVQLEQAQEQICQQGQAALLESLRRKEEEWRSQLDQRLWEKEQHVQEKLLAEVKEVLKEVQDQRSTVTEEHSNREGGVRASLRELCREAVCKAVSHSKQDWKRTSEERLRHLLKEKQEHHDRELNQIHSSMAQRNKSACSEKGCTETVARLQKKSQDLQRHLEKACRQLQHTVREHKSTMHKLKEEHEEALNKQRESHAKEIEEIKCDTARAAESQQNLRAGLEEMKNQYEKTVGKIRGDMLQYLQESKKRAAELIRSEVLRERQDTARRMRRYYLTCLQELLEEGSQTTGAEKKIINAASKLAAMAKVLETPVSKKKLQRNQNVQDSVSNPEVSTSHHPATASSQIAAESLADNRKMHQTLTETENTAKLRGTNTSKKDFQADVKCVSARAPELTPVQPKSLCSHNPKSASDFTSPAALHRNISTTNVTLRKQSREMYMTEAESGKDGERETPLLAGKHFLIEEAPVRDDGQSDWSLFSNGSTFTSNIHFTTYASKIPEAVKPFSLTGPLEQDLDFGSNRSDNSDLTVYKEIVKKSIVKATPCTDIKMATSREPIPGSEGEKVKRLCPKSLFSEFKSSQQDSGFDSPLSLIQK